MSKGLVAYSTNSGSTGEVAAAFIMAVVQVAPGDYRDWDAIKAWSRSIGELF